VLLVCPKCRFKAILRGVQSYTPSNPPLCPKCKTPIPVPYDEERPFAPGVADGPEPKSTASPWEERSSWLDLGAFWRTAWSLLFRPSAAFATLNYNTGIGSSLVFGLVYGSLGQIISRYWFTLINIQDGTLEPNVLGNTMEFAGTALLTPLFVILSLFIGCGAVHLTMRVLGGARRSLAATFQVLSYVTGATALLNVLPLLGSFIMPLWALVLNTIGLAVAHRTSKVKALFALLLPFILVGLLAAGVLLLVATVGLFDLLDRISKSM
jgi:hypothetical protein